MNLKPLIPEIQKLCRESNITMLAVFGSVARGEDSAKSDIDLLVKFDQPVGFIEFIQLENRLTRVFGKNVDLATEKSLHPLIEKDVKRELQVLYEG